MKTVQIEGIAISQTLETLLNELGDECKVFLDLLSRLKTSGLSKEQLEEILGEMVGSVAHLHVHTEGLEGMIGEELEKV